ncbi:MAG TPA: HupE/UreJ family protein [Polyangiaceae bacterium]|nr:HupE/UreJ family protein [Polyangiaceae bacterium]
MSRSQLVRMSSAALAFAVASSAASVAGAHGLAMDQVLLQPDRAAHVLRGQVTFDPHHSRGEARAIAPDTEQRVLSTLRNSLVVEIDGKRCPLELEVRELWEPAGATVGDIVRLSCPLPVNARELQVFAGSALTVLIVSVQAPSGSDAARTVSVLVQGGAATPVYRFDRAPEAWREGGANQFLADGGLASTAPDVPAATPTAVASPMAVAPAASNGRFEESSGALFWRYVRLGFTHILPSGWDHVLFVTGLVLGASGRLRRLLIELSAFTLAHTMTLGLGALGVFAASPRLVEPLIALSIAFIGFENLRAKPSPRGRLALVFGFGFLHGMGFASALAQIGLARDSFVLSLLSFNGGVELGQLAVVVVLMTLLAPVRDEGRLRRFVVRPASIAIAGAGIAWALARVFGYA